MKETIIIMLVGASLMAALMLLAAYTFYVMFATLYPWYLNMKRDVQFHPVEHHYRRKAVEGRGWRILPVTLRYFLSLFFPQER